MKDNRLGTWILPSIGDVVFLCIFFWILQSGLGLLNDGDTGWHIVTGRAIIDTLRIPSADPYSYTMPGTPWTAHEWLAEVIFAGVDRVAGLNGVVVFTAALISLTCFFLYRYMVHIRVSPLTASILTVLAALASSLHWLARPHVFSFLMTLAFMVVLELYQREGKDRLKYLPLLMALWVNLHAGYILGIMLMVIYAGGNIAKHVMTRGADPADMRRAKALGLFTAITVAATFLNPHGPAILYFPFHLVGRQYIMDNILEWLSPNFHTDKLFEAMLLYIATVFVVSDRKPDIIEGGGALLMVHMSLYSARYIPLLAIIVMPMAAARTGELLGRVVSGMDGVGIAGRVASRIERISANVTPMELRFNRHVWVYAAIAGCMIVAVNGGRLGNTKLMEYTHDKKVFPVDAMEFAVKNGITGNMFNNDGWGGYIIYRYYPEYRVFMDGRSDMYGVDFLKQYVKVARAKPGYRDVLEKYNVGWAIFNADRPLCELLVRADGWRLVYADKTANVIVRNAPEYAGIISRYKDVQFAEVEDGD